MSPTDSSSTSPINGGEPSYKRLRVAGDRIRGLSSHLERKRDMRWNHTSAEWKLWLALKNRQVEGLKFRRQHGIGPYIVDFYCDQLKLIIEVDGCIHSRKDVSEYDHVRSQFLEDNEYKILRFTNQEIEIDLSRVLGAIVSALPSIYGGVRGGVESCRPDLES